ncbi:MAG: hypothetical protein COV74_06070 [Candidatus Omnitrophica bacterium CG11_big_fil_rev_8_21_14_0_20_45_26]|uniref:Winged helix-turn-helix domain-containing protein n=1 Tax=Candidatus Abzuiibacterium crystallinum TaxID=1974748 RepID=A0A2H0LNV6_9BACT|nr:MAG: hypothetical protein COV74_06070 [Candidatus Omnitrophica bacterium CG11_big_fil_rev_8_21_14_0_20_45_26]PIW65316.1 MAG: hypothetical protein COW12_02575 [Candidatus Omnitrophica bacterium CG12_big_fil_rev_8_21_14_0_65_45_16]
MHGQCQRIGEAAGKIYQALENGSKTLEALAKETHLNDAALFNQAIGWLCREDKLRFEKKGTSSEVTLTTSSAGSCCK